MKAWGRFTLIFLAYGITLLHTAVPHHHGSSSDGRVSISYAGCRFEHNVGGFLEMFFSPDLGYGHLEIFKKSPDTKIDFSAPYMGVSAVLPSIVLREVTGRPVPVSATAFVDKLRRQRLLFSATGFRGPPAIA